METINIITRPKIACAGASRGSYSVAPFVGDVDALNGTAVITRWAGALSKVGVVDPGPDELYRSGWLSDVVGTPISYTLTGLVPLVTYQIRLHFAAPTGTVAGDMVMDLQFIGNLTTTQNDYDPVVAAGAAAKANVFELAIAASALGVIAVTVTCNTGKDAILCGIEVVPPAIGALSIPSLPAPSAPAALTIPTRPTPSAPSALTIPSRPTPSAPAAITIPSRPTPGAITAL